MENKDNSGVLFQNNKKTTDKQPGWKGSATIGGMEYWLAAWVNLDKKKNKYISLKFDLKEGQSEVQKKLDKDESDIPF